MDNRRLSNASSSSPMRVSPNGIEKKKPFLIGVAGGTASGKSTVCDRIMKAVTHSDGSNTERKIISISQDSFYKNLDETDSLKASKGTFDFDHPDAFDMELMKECLMDIQSGKPTKIPKYDFKTNSRLDDDQSTLVNPSDVVLVEGILVFYTSTVREMFDMKLFVDTDADTRLSRRVLRDIDERGRDLETVLTQYTTLVKPAFEEFCLPTKKFADVIIPRGAENTVAIDLIVQHIKDLLDHKVQDLSSGDFNVNDENLRQKIRHKSDSFYDARPH